MKGLTDYITESPWEAILTATFVLIDDECQVLNEQFFPNRKYAQASSHSSMTRASIDDGMKWPRGWKQFAVGCATSGERHIP